MPRDRFGLPIHQVHIADGFSTDCDEIVNRCLQLKPLDFKEFAKLWKEMNFDLLYEGRSSSAEIAELSEELIHIAKHYMVKDTSYFEESVTGLFLVYSLVNLQPFPGFASLRLVPSDVRAVNRIETVARRERRLDVLYILGEVLTKWTQYHADERPRGMENVLRKYLESFTSIDKLGVRPVGVFYRQNEELDNIRDVGSMTRQYLHAKAALFSDGCEEPSLKYINERLPNQLNSSLRKLVMGVIEDDCDYDQENVSEEDEEEEEEVERKMSEDRLTTVQAIKAKAMSNAVDPMNHLTSAENRKKSKTTPASSSDLKTPTGKIKSGSHMRPITTSPKKAKTKRKPNVITDSDDSDDDADADLLIEEFNQISDDHDDETNDDGNDDGNADDDDDDDEKSQEIKQQEHYELQYDESMAFNMESLPLILRTGDFGPDIEIKIIDHTKPKRKKTEAPKVTNPVVITPTPGTPKTTKRTKTPKTPNSAEEDKLSIKSRLNFLKTYKKDRKDDIALTIEGLPRRIKGKRDQKRREIKSRFQRQGLLPIANFEDKVEKS